LEKHGGLRLADQDVFVSAVGGLKVIEPAADLALCLAIAGAHYNRTMPAGVAVIGEVGLGGEIRHVHQVEQRCREAVRLGYRTIALPQNGPRITLKNVDTLSISHLSGAIEILTAGVKKS
jgi:DNA repair protein RadA/Sms